MKILHFKVSTLSNSSWMNKGFVTIFISAGTQVAAHTTRFSEGSRERGQDITEPDTGKERASKNGTEMESLRFPQHLGENRLHSAPEPDYS